MIDEKYKDLEEELNYQKQSEERDKKNDKAIYYLLHLQMRAKIFFESFKEDIIDELPDKGNKCSESQKVCLQQALNNLEQTFNGLDIKDFQEDA